MKTLLRKIKWANILGEVVLIFVAINLSIWFNNWNSRRIAEKDLTTALAKVKEELNTNLEELQATQAIHQKLLAAYAAHAPLFSGSSSQFIATPTQRMALALAHPGFYTLQDSTAREDGRYLYRGSLYIEMEFPDLSAIAWSTTRSLNLGKGLSYDCLFELEATYTQQERVMEQLDVALAALQAGNSKQMITTLQVVDQLTVQVIADYKEVLQNLDHCR